MSESGCTSDPTEPITSLVQVTRSSGGSFEALSGAMLVVDDGPSYRFPPFDLLERMVGLGPIHNLTISWVATYTDTPFGDVSPPLNGVGRCW